MMIHEITEKAGKHKKRKRIGRGPGSGYGKTAGRGHKGAGSRSGFGGSIRASREGGQMPLFRRWPKRGFSNARFRKHFAVVNLAAIADRFEDGAEVNPDMLAKVGLIHDTKLPVKVLGDTRSGDFSRKLTVSAHAFSAGAKRKIDNAGGSVTQL